MARSAWQAHPEKGAFHAAPWYKCLLGPLASVGIKETYLRCIADSSLLLFLLL